MGASSCSWDEVKQELAPMGRSYDMRHANAAW